MPGIVRGTGGLSIRALPVPGFEEVLVGTDEASGYRGIVAIHSTRLGPAVGGTRLRSYPSEAEAIDDALRLARSMTWKNAAAGLPLGGGKSVVMAPAGGGDRDDWLRAHAALIHTLGGRYIAAEDVGTTPADMALMAELTPHVAGLPDRSGDPAPWTARGVLRAMEACALLRWGSVDLAGRRVVVQGCGSVGQHLAAELARCGASLLVADTDAARARVLAARLGADVLAPSAVYAASADILAPCALGGILNARTIPLLEAGIVAGAANNQLENEADSERLRARGILHVPDFIASAGGVINGCRELVGWDAQRCSSEVDAIFGRTLDVLVAAAVAGTCTARAAALYVNERLEPHRS